MNRRITRMMFYVSAFIAVFAIYKLIDSRFITLERGACLIRDHIEFGQCSDIVEIVEIGKRKVLLKSADSEWEEAKIFVKENFDIVSCECTERPVRK